VQIPAGDPGEGDRLGAGLIEDPGPSSVNSPVSSAIGMNSFGGTDSPS
jgi:hypothetical protein